MIYKGRSVTPGMCHPEMPHANGSCMLAVAKSGKDRGPGSFFGSPVEIVDLRLVTWFLVFSVYSKDGVQLPHCPQRWGLPTMLDPWKLLFCNPRNLIITEVWLLKDFPKPPKFMSSLCSCLDLNLDIYWEISVISSFQAGERKAMNVPLATAAAWSLEVVHRAQVGVARQRQL